MPNLEMSPTKSYPQIIFVFALNFLEMCHLVDCKSFYKFSFYRLPLTNPPGVWWCTRPSIRESKHWLCSWPKRLTRWPTTMTVCVRSSRININTIKNVSFLNLIYFSNCYIASLCTNMARLALSAVKKNVWREIKDESSLSLVLFNGSSRPNLRPNLQETLKFR